MPKLRIPMHDGVFTDVGLFGLALRRGFPGIRLRPGEYVESGWEAWRCFCEHAAPGERAAARHALGDPGTDDAAA